MDVRSGDRADRMQMFAKELVGLQADVILAGGTPVTAALQRETRTIPIVFAGVSDPDLRYQRPCSPLPTK
jgi:putative tryptophan/tyrosine transport system substrate-binding protein